MGTLRRDLGDGLVLKAANNEADIERVADFDSIIFESRVGELCRCLFLYYPGTQPSDLIFVEDRKTSEIVSSLCLIPWQLRYEEVILNAGEMGIVGTLEPYRHRGLIRAQVNYFKELLIKRGFDLSIIQGIPYFYRQFGYEYALPLGNSLRMEMNQIPDLPGGGASHFICRPATITDLPLLEQLYNESASDLAIHTCRDRSIWQYLMEHNPSTCNAVERWIVETADGNISGYFCIQKYPFGESLTVNEASKLDYESAMAVLRHLKKLAIELHKPNINLVLPANCVLAQVARYYGASDSGTYAWQIYIPNIVRFLRKICPVLECRLAESPFAGLTEEIHISLYKEELFLRFSDGKLTDVSQLKLSDNWRRSIHIPPRALAPLILGYRSREELQKLWPDMGAEPKQAYLLDILFPRMDSYIYPAY